MEANKNTAPETPEVPELEQGIAQDPQETNIGFNDIIGVPTPEPAETPQSTDTPQPVMDQQAPAQDFSENEVPANDNDQVRYQHWQSQAAKLQNQLDEVKEYMPMVDYLRANPEAVQSITPGGQAPAEAAPTSQEQEEFPPPPAKPEQPHGFSREEAFSDPRSESAKYLNDIDKWRDDMQTYSNLQNQYEIATMRESYNQKLSELEKKEAARQEQAQAAQKMNDVRNFVNDNYDLGENLDDFIKTMNDPSSLSMDELVGYYKYKKGLTTQPQTPQQAAPSNAFKQVQRAQSVPTPMGVQPAQGNAPESPSDNFMDALLKSDNKRNIL